LDQYPLPNGDTLDVRTVRIYATMNPASAGGGRSQLPRSLRNLFTAVQVGKPSTAEVRDIASDLFGVCLDHGLLEVSHVDKLLNFHQAAITGAERRDLGRSGTPAEFNLRDLIKVSET
jgi:midasin (ATPase involved in ribosome maturation)